MVNVLDFGVSVDNLDNQPQFQAAIDYAISTGERVVYVPYNIKPYKISKGLVVCGAYDVQRSNYRFTSIKITSDNKAYRDLGTKIQVLDKVSFGIGVQSVKGFELENITFVGNNQAITSHEVTDRNAYTDCAVKNFAPYSGVVIDPFHKSSPDKYPGFEQYYINESRAGSTDIIIKGCSSDGFTVGYMLAPNGNTQNCDCITIQDSWIGKNMYGICIGQSQSRNVKVSNTHCWSRVHTVIDCMNMGASSGPMPYIDNMDLAGGQHQFIYASTKNGAEARNVFAESLYRIGKVGDAILPTKFYNCTFHLDNSVKKTNSIFSGTAWFDNCTIRYYDGKENLMPAYIRPYTKFTNCLLSSPIIPLSMNVMSTQFHQEYGSGMYYDCTLYPSFIKVFDQADFTYTSGFSYKIMSNKLNLNGSHNSSPKVDAPMIDAIASGQGSCYENIIETTTSGFQVGDRIMTFGMSKFIDGGDKSNVQVPGTIRSIDGNKLVFDPMIKLMPDVVGIYKVIFNSVQLQPKNNT